MPTTFASQLRSFARAVDIVDDATFDGVRKLIVRYVEKDLGAHYFELMREHAIGHGRGLGMFWSSRDTPNAWPLRTEAGAYTNAVTASYAERRPVWAVSPDEAPLGRAVAMSDEWSQLPDLPAPYLPMAESGDTRTLVVVPLVRKQPLGVLYFESAECITVTEVAKLELRLLGEALAILVELYETNRTQSRMTSSALDELRDSLESARFPKLTKPHFFVAYSHRADSKVRVVIQQVLHRYGKQIEYTDWAKVHEAGNINAHIAREIARSRFGICYLSEPVGTDDGAHRYSDNPNVVFEAGMLHARTSESDGRPTGEPCGWIPVREESSPPAPFDFASERMLHVPRYEDGELDEGGLRQQLTDRIEGMLHQE
jgi:hypothetical protein